MNIVEYIKGYRLLVAFSICIFAPLGSVTADELPNASYDWQELYDIEPEQSYEKYDDKAEWWGQLMVKLSDEFGRVCAQSDADMRLKSLVEEFGKETHGPMADLKLCLLAPDVFLAQGYPSPTSDVPEGVNEKRRERYREIKLLVCRLQIETFLKKPELLDRYYRALVWSHQLFGPSHSHYVLLGFKAGYVRDGLKPNTDNYWWYARDFILLVHATGQDHLLKDVKPGELDRVFVKWNIWLQENHELLQGHPTEPIWVVGTLLHAMQGGPQKLNEPKYPFPNWEEKVPLPSPKLISTMKDFIGLEWIKEK